MNIDKNTNNDKRNILRDALNNSFKESNPTEWAWMMDFDDTYIYFELNQEGEDNTKRVTYTFDGIKAEIGKDSEEVVRLTEYKVIPETTELEKSIMQGLKKFFGGSAQKAAPNMDVIKQFGGDDEPMYAIEPLYTSPGEVDGHGDVASLETITYMVESINKANEDGRLQPGLFHKHLTTSWQLDKAWVNPVECMIGDQLVPEGQPIAKTIFSNKEAFDMRVSGEIAGLSIGARAKEIIDLDKDAGELTKLQGQPEALRELKGIHFDWEHPELTYTSPSQGGAASMKNTAYVIDKAKKAKIEDLDKDQLSIIGKIGEEFISLEKHLGVDETITPSSEGLGENINDTGTQTMSDQTHEEVLKELKAVRRENAIIKAQKGIEGHKLGADLEEGVAGILADLDKDNQALLNKAFTKIKADADEALTVAVDKAKAEAAPTADTELQKALDAEDGTGGEPEPEVAKSFTQQIAAFQDAEGTK